jgi:hypothetical protein
VPITGTGSSVLTAVTARGATAQLERALTSPVSLESPSRDKSDGHSRRFAWKVIDDHEAVDFPLQECTEERRIVAEGNTTI